jgi:hypothetical protein
VCEIVRELNLDNITGLPAVVITMMFTPAPLALHRATTKNDVHEGCSSFGLQPKLIRGTFVLEPRHLQVPQRLSQTNSFQQLSSDVYHRPRAGVLALAGILQRDCLRMDGL